MAFRDQQGILVSKDKCYGMAVLKNHEDVRNGHHKENRRIGSGYSSKEKGKACARIAQDK